MLIYFENGGRRLQGSRGRLEEGERKRKKKRRRRGVERRGEERGRERGAGRQAENESQEGFVLSTQGARLDLTTVDHDLS